MIVKVEMADHRFQMFDNIKSVAFTKPNTYCPTPPEECFKSDKKLESFIQDVLADTEAMEDLDGPKPVNRFLGVMQDDLPGDRKILFAGQMTDDEKHSFKAMTFMQGNTEVWIYSQFPVYVCDDKGKTVEIVK